jgi:hypothetical protein
MDKLAELTAALASLAERVSALEAKANAPQPLPNPDTLAR